MENKTQTPNPRTCAQMREQFHIRQTDPDMVASIARSKVSTILAEKVFEEEGYLITREMIGFQADQILIWGDRDYDDPPLQSAIDYMDRQEIHWERHREKKRIVWKAKQDCVDETYPRIKGKVLNNLPKPFREMAMKCGLVPDLKRLFTKVVFHNLDGTRFVRLRKGDESIAQVRRSYLLHHGWDGKEAEPEWAAEVRITDVRYVNRTNGPAGRYWVVGRVPSPNTKLSNYIDPFPGTGDDGNYRWIGERLVFDPHGSLIGYCPGAHRLSMAEFETALVQGANFDEDPIENELVGGPPVTLDMDEALNWAPMDDDCPFDPRERGPWNRARFHKSALSHDLQFFHEILEEIGEIEAASELLNGPATHHRFNLIKTARGLVIEHLDPEPQLAPWENDVDLKIAMLKAMGPVLAAEYHSYL